MRRFRQPPDIRGDAYDPVVTPYRNLAIAVIKQSVDDYNSCDVLRHEYARSFFFGTSEAQVFIRAHWFNQAGLVVMDAAAIEVAISHAKRRKTYHRREPLSPLPEAPENGATDTGTSDPRTVP